MRAETFLAEGVREIGCGAAADVGLDGHPLAVLRADFLAVGTDGDKPFQELLVQFFHVARVSRRFVHEVLANIVVGLDDMVKLSRETAWVECGAGVAASHVQKSAFHRPQPAAQWAPRPSKTTGMVFSKIRKSIHNDQLSI